jgi:PAS domain S-box-containing protein
MVDKRIEIENQLKRKNEKLNETIKNLQMILDSTTEMIVFSKNGIIIDANNAVYETTGYSKREIIAKNMLDFIPKSETQKTIKALQKEKQDTHEVKIYKKDGSILDVLAKGRNVIQNGDVVRMSTFVDLTQVKQRDEAIALSKAKSEFLANMSHEIRTPLNGILGFVDILKEENLSKNAKHYLGIIDESSRILLNVIEDILDFSKIENGKLEIEKINFNTIKELQSTIDLFRAKASEKNIVLEVDIKENIPSFIISDPLRIKQILSNLLSNAIKFTPSGKKIYVDISYDYETNRLKVKVKDEGIGISKDKLEHIFEAFTQEDSSTTRRYGGTGLGLAISSKLAKLLGGDLGVSSEVGVGSEFFFEIPAKIGKETNEDKRVKISDFSNIKILLVEDNIANQMFMKVLLKKLNIEFDIANNGKEAVDIYKGNSDKYDVILMDENMPIMNGIEATRQILEYERDNNIKHTPIIALTANAIKGDRERFLSAGMDEYLSKPISKDKLCETLERFV